MRDHITDWEHSTNASGELCFNNMWLKTAKVQPP